MRRLGVMIRMAKVCFAELSFDALPITEVSSVFERVEHEGLNGSRQVTFVYDDFNFPCKSSRQCVTFAEFEAYFRKEIEVKFEQEILRLEGLGSFPRLSFSLSYGNVSCDNTEVSREMIGKLAKMGMKLCMSFASKSRNSEVRIEFPASLVRFLAKYHFAIAF